MDKAGIDYAHVSLATPGPEAFPLQTGKKLAAEYNDAAARLIKEHPDRFGAYMSLYPQDPDWSVREIDRAAKMGLFGWSCLSNMGGKRIDDPKYLPIFRRLEELDMPVYLHPTFTQWDEFREFSYCINGPALGFEVDVRLTFMRMLYRGLFDRFPKLKIILGHDGEGFSFCIDRIDTAYRQGYAYSMPGGEPIRHEPSYYVKHNVWMTTSGNFLPEALRCTLDVMPKDRVMAATDFPYEDYVKSIDLIAENPGLSEEEKIACLSGNAKKLGFGPKK